MKTSKASDATSSDRSKRDKASLDHLIPREPFRETIGQHIHEGVYLEIAKRLRILEKHHEKSSLKHWSQNVRLYTLLRMLGHDDGDPVLETFEHQDIGDTWLPLPDAVLKKLALLTPFDTSKFAETQLYILSDPKMMDERHLTDAFFNWQHKQGPRSRVHRYLEYVDAHFTDLGEIAHGSSAKVLRVRHELTGKEFACKRLPRKPLIKDQKHQLKLFRQEVKVLERVRHHHIVGLVASFTDYDSFTLILDPIADRVLSSLLEQEEPFSEDEISTLRFSFNCLATALEFLHSNSIRHKDIKPGNILINTGRIRLCDFGISLEWQQGENGTTEGYYSSFTRRYAAPEVFSLEVSRNNKTDVWSLGCVFLEIITVMRGYRIQELDMDRCDNGGPSASEMMNWLQRLRTEEQNDTISDLAIGWVLRMIQHDPMERLPSRDLVEIIRNDATQHDLRETFLDFCCYNSAYESNANNSSNVSSGIVRRASPWGHSNVPTTRGEIPSYGPSNNAPIPQDSGSAEPLSKRLFSPDVSNFSIGISGGLSADGLLSEKLQGTPTQTLSTSSEEGPINQNILHHQSSTSNVRLQTPQPACHRPPTDCGIRPGEVLIYEAPFASFDIKELAKADKFMKCCRELQNTMRIFQTPTATLGAGEITKQSISKVTRRIVFSNIDPTSAIGCFSFWLPLAAIESEVHLAGVTLRWSECGHLQDRKDEDLWGSTVPMRWPIHIANEVFVKFHNDRTALWFLEKVRGPFGCGSPISLSPYQEMRIWTLGDVRDKERLFACTHYDGHATKVTEMYTSERYLNLSIATSYADTLSTVVKLSRIKNLSYSGDILSCAMDRPLLGSVNKHLRSLENITYDTLTLKSAGVTSVLPSDSIIAMFKELIGWKLHYIAYKPRVQIKGTNLNGKSCQHVTIWISDPPDQQPKILFCYEDERGGYFWISGVPWTSNTTALDLSSTARDSSCILDMTRVQHGNLLDTYTMSAVADSVLNSPPATRAIAQEMQGRVHDVEITFESPNELYRFRRSIKGFCTV